ncbi:MULTISPECIES: GAG-binding domain-containing protein [unclassified Granulicatella]|uniref:GAG-binding domain-containing protein n=1 Tax=unclassified Granulicatella TaxID=2630493 RepID=UPI001073C635|nr:MULTISPECIES: GAG-binding domain-containing protein [unclassified Granulicatella]MBF0779950.1 G5 domain-containing protein [Granulicatella sp. 19428wC4_WM01]TFU95966.1 YSIRK-type signal peptide-containing protein [Granulicatella sp. WM01]
MYSDNKKHKMLKYSIRKGKLGVGSIAIAAILFGASMYNGVTVYADNETVEVQSVAQSRIEEYRKMYQTIKELVDDDYGNYNDNIGDAPGADLTERFADANSSEELLKQTLIEFVNYGLIYENGEYQSFKTVDDFKPVLEANYADALEKRKTEKIMEIDQSNAPQSLKDKYKSIIGKETSLRKVRTEILDQFKKDVANIQREALQADIEKAKDEVNKLPYLREKDKYLKQLDNVSSKDEITNILNEAKQEAERDQLTFETVEKIREEIKKLSYLTNEHKAHYNSALDSLAPYNAINNANLLLIDAKRENRKALIRLLTAERTKFEMTLAEIDKLPEAPDKDDYKMQKYLWKHVSVLGKGRLTQIDNAKNTNYLNLLDPELEKLYKDLQEVHLQSKIELFTRQVVPYREKYPNRPSIEKEFTNGLKQTKDNHYGSLELEGGLRDYVENVASKALNEIKRIVGIIDKKEEVLKVLADLEKEVSKKPLVNKLLDDLAKIKNAIMIIDDTVDGLAEQFLDQARDKVKEYEKDYAAYLQAIENGKQEARLLIDNLFKNGGMEAIVLANRLQSEVDSLKQATLSGDKDYRTFVPKVIESIRKQIEEYFSKLKPSTPLVPSIVESIETETVEVDYQVKEIENPDLPQGTRNLKQMGVKGERTVTYKVRRQGDKVLSREKVDEKVTKLVVDQFVEIGTKKVQMPKTEDDNKGMVPPKRDDMPEDKGNHGMMPKPEDDNKGMVPPKHDDMPEDKGDKDMMPKPEGDNKGMVPQNRDDMPKDKGDQGMMSPKHDDMSEDKTKKDSQEDEMSNNMLPKTGTEQSALPFVGGMMLSTGVILRRTRRRRAR